ncbi:hypothetical protein AHIS1636_31960 [Arthrobacter mangrovi]|uniref:Uncharacterized protein n=1 Tax=Arthrobacter mangrovi TaxID=2966350 RepID=A0ABQ5MXP2_9MICC|nr:hypothetical protein AHIS1636_31960 [Arthrobacter mangrovi]
MFQLLRLGARRRKSRQQHKKLAQNIATLRDMRAGLRLEMAEHVIRNPDRTFVARDGRVSLAPGNPYSAGVKEQLEKLTQTIEGWEQELENWERDAAAEMSDFIRVSGSASKETTKKLRQYQAGWK